MHRNAHGGTLAAPYSREAPVMAVIPTLAPVLREQRRLEPGRPYPERAEREPTRAEDIAGRVRFGPVQTLVQASGVQRRRARAFAERVLALGEEAAALDDAALKRAALVLRPALRRSAFGFDTTARAFALVREAGFRTTGMRHYSTQLMAGWWLLRGTLVEMATGEGKSYAATLAATSAALAGMPVHVITVNDYLAARDAATFAPLYAFFGLRAGAVTNGLPPAARQSVYAGNVTYLSNSELVFDYLRDRSQLGDNASPLHVATQALDGSNATARLLLRGLVFGIVDEADSVFIDEARTPLILSRTRSDDTRPPVADALAWASELQAGSHFVIETARRRIRLTAAGVETIEERLDDAAGTAAGAPFATLRSAREWIERALAALYLYTLDQHYVIADGKILIVDESTGRAMPDRSWERGLHQLVEAKEGVAASDPRETMARITYQRFFRRYLTLGGMSGTAAEVAAEIGVTYGLPVARVPLHRPSLRRMAGARCYANQADKWAAVVAAVTREAVDGRRPVLIGTRTVQASERLSAALAAAGIAHVVLNARQDREEQQIVAQAGNAARVTVATNMAGRGTDIALGEGVAACGGLHVILTEYHESRRIDRQLFGRSARQGDPGSGEAIVALDDDLFQTHAPRLAAWLARRRSLVTGVRLAILRRHAQRAAEAQNRDQRDAALKQDRRFARLLAFAGRGE